MTGDFERGEPLSWGACEGAGPLCRSWEAGFRADPATECGSNPIARSNIFNHFAHGPPRNSFPCHGFSHGSVGNRDLYPIRLGCLRADRNRPAKARHRFDSGFQVGGIAPDQSGIAVPQQGGNSALSLAAHGQPTGEGMPQGVPGHIFQLEGLHCRDKDPRVQVPLIQVRGWILRQKYPRRPLPRIEPPQDRRRFFIQIDILHMTGLRVGQSQNAPLLQAEGASAALFR